jgi:hypothetical protein
VQARRERKRDSAQPSGRAQPPRKEGDPWMGIGNLLAV